MKLLLIATLGSTLCGAGIWAGAETIGQEYTILTLHAAVVLGIGTALVRANTRNTEAIVTVSKVLQALQDEIKELRDDVKELRQRSA